MYSLGLDKEPGQRDLGETLRVTLGKHDVPIAVEMALLGAKKGAERRIEVPPHLGFATSNWLPQPATFEGKQRMEGYRKLLTGNVLQPGYEAILLFEVNVVRIRSPSAASSSATPRATVGVGEGAAGREREDAGSSSQTSAELDADEEEDNDDT
mmetsp:Transcript_49316/g.79587  ORF Transcript_49316/g.79587 Transcript_49316/m.79587 type:complete len:154 (+) Transcript_49316:62-523(+)